MPFATNMREMSLSALLFGKTSLGRSIAMTIAVFILLSSPCLAESSKPTPAQVNCINALAQRLFTIDINGRLSEGTPSPPGATRDRIGGKWSTIRNMSQRWRDRYQDRYDAHYDGKPRPLVILDKTHFPYAGVQGERLHYEGKSYWLVNIGDHQALADRALLDPMYKAATGDKPYQITEIFFTGKKAEGIEFLRERRRIIESKVRDVYRAKKQYLPEEDLTSVQQSDHYDSNGDIFVILKDRGIAPPELTAAQFDKDALMTIRISRRDKKSVHYPSKLDDWSNRFLRGTPFTLRMTYAQQQAMEKQYRTLGNPRKIAELTRYAKFGEVPPPIRDAMLYRAFSVAKEKAHPIDVFLASMDQGIRERLEVLWGFKEFMPLVTEQPVDMPEYLMYLKSNSPEYEGALERFRQSASVTWEP